MALFGIDLSTYQGDLDFAAVKRAGVRFAIVKATQGYSLSSSAYLFKDSKFQRNIEGLSKVGIPVGAYHFFTAPTLTECWREADFFIDTIKPYKNKIELYAACDAENYSNKNLLNLNRNELTTQINEFNKRVEKAGFKTCIYTNTDHVNNFIDLSKLNYPVWLAHYGKDLSRPKSAGDNLAIHQYTGSGTLPGVSGVFDLNFGYGQLAILIIRSRCGLEDQTFNYISNFATGEDILMKLADKLVARDINPIRTPTTEKLIPLIRLSCNLSNAQSEYLANYKYADDLFRKLYTAMITG